MKNKMFRFLIILSLLPSVAFASECGGVFTQESYEMITDILGYIRIGVPILLILLSSGDFISAVVSQDQEVLKKSSRKLIKRFIAAASVFLIPTSLYVVLTNPSIKDSLNLVDDPLCENSSFKTEGEYKDEYNKNVFKINKKSTSIMVDKTEKLRISSGDDSNVTWSSSDKSIAKVDKNGEVKGIKKGSVKITAKSGSKEAYCTVRVYDKYEYNGNGGSSGGGESVSCKDLGISGVSVGSPLSPSQYSQAYSKLSDLTNSEVVSLMKSKKSVDDSFAKLVVGTTVGEGYVNDTYYNYAWANVLITSYSNRSADSIYDEMHPSNCGHGHSGWELVTNGVCGNWYTKSSVEGRYDKADQATLRAVYLAICYPDTKIKEVDGLCSNTINCSSKYKVCTCS